MLQMSQFRNGPLLDNSSSFYKLFWVIHSSLKIMRSVFYTVFVVTNIGSNVTARGFFYFAFCAISCAVSLLLYFCTFYVIVSNVYFIILIILLY